VKEDAWNAALGDKAATITAASSAERTMAPWMEAEMRAS
jgi:hypothetical protein